MLHFTIIHIPVLQSTNEYMQMLLRSGEYSEGLVVSTDLQLHGKGHGGNRWESLEGQNLLFSLLLNPVFIEPARQFLINQCVSMALLKAIIRTIGNHRVNIKWPNDIYVENKKVSGILIQNTIRGDQIVRAIVGIGLNINQVEFPSDVPNPVSLKQVAGHEIRKEEVFKTLLMEINTIYSGLSSGAFQHELNADYLSHLYRYGEWARFDDGSPFEGRISGITDYGQLLLEKRDGELRTYGFKEVEYLGG